MRPGPCGVPLVLLSILPPEELLSHSGWDPAALDRDTNNHRENMTRSPRRIIVHSDTFKFIIGSHTVTPPNHCPFWHFIIFVQKKQMLIEPLVDRNPLLQWHPAQFIVQTHKLHVGKIPLQFFLNGAEHSFNSVNSGNMIYPWSKNWNEFKDPVSRVCIAETVVTS